MGKIFAFVIALAAIFVWWTSRMLPAVVASHFVADGTANGFMPRATYVGTMLALVVLVPSLVFFIGRFASHLPYKFINLPNKQYWLAPERRAASLASLGNFGSCVGFAVALLLCFVHWLVVRANQVQPAHLEQASLVGVMAVFILVIGAGVAVNLRRFFRVP
jgi:hypothetical protein